MRYCAIFLLIGLLLACGSTKPQGDSIIKPLPTDTGTFTLRFNPVKSLSARPELALELAFGKHWERIAIADADPERPVTARLLEVMRTTPDANVTVTGELTRSTVSWGRGHVSRILEVDAIHGSDGPRITP